MINVCCCLRLKSEQIIKKFLKTSFQWSLIGTLSLCKKKQMPKFVKSKITFPQPRAEVFATRVEQKSGAR